MGKCLCCSLSGFSLFSFFCFHLINAVLRLFAFKVLKRCLHRSSILAFMFEILDFAQTEEDARQRQVSPNLPIVTLMNVCIPIFHFPISNKLRFIAAADRAAGRSKWHGTSMKRGTMEWWSLTHRDAEAVNFCAASASASTKM